MAEHRTSADEPATEPEQIESQIQETRRELGDTVAALADKADVKKQARQKADETKAAAQTKATEATAAARRVPVRARENPAIAAGGAAVAALALLLLLRARKR
jgi:Skp family chaperone for outer membrane proteins